MCVEAYANGTARGLETDTNYVGRTSRQMSASGHDGVAVVEPGQTYVGKQGFTYGAGASSETVGAQKVCMNVLPGYRCFRSQL